MDIGQEITAARQRAGLTQAELAQRAGTAQSAISAYESGRKQPSAEVFLRLLAAAGTRLAPVESEPVRAPSRAERARRGRILEQVIELAEALPARHAPVLPYPSLRTLVTPGT
ncbi:MAG: helix-turn-helix transcriptional regulator [Solirubrobacteraceae bacterium]|nr:helix-turn-helix transcriptional regulator [Solirubrobacteraceae bacterium]